MSQTEPTPPRQDWRSQRHAEREERRASRRASWGGASVGGLVVLLIGVVLLARNMGMPLPENWWAAFLLIPAAGSFVSAVRAYNEDGQLNGRAGGSIVAGIIFLLLAVLFYLGINWGAVWPVILILLGAGLMARSYWPR